MVCYEKRGERKISYYVFLYLLPIVVVPLILCGCLHFCIFDSARGIFPLGSNPYKNCKIADSFVAYIDVRLQL